MFDFIEKRRKELKRERARKKKHTHTGKKKLKTEMGKIKKQKTGETKFSDNFN